MNSVLKLVRAGHKEVRKRQNLRCNGIPVAQRTREIGIRMALGAQNHQVLRLMLWQGINLAIGGVVLGAIFSFALTGFLRGLVFGVTITDPVTFLAASSILTVSAVLACWVPSRKVIRMDPMIALRHE